MGSKWRTTITSVNLPPFYSLQRLVGIELVMVSDSGGVSFVAHVFILWDVFQLILLSIYKRTVFTLWPEERKKDLERVTKGTIAICD